MVGNKNSGRKGGNPLLGVSGAVPRTGPNTEAGKLAVVASHLKHGRHSKHIKKWTRYGCDQCPLREREWTTRIGNKTVTKTKPAICPQYEKGKKKCTLDQREMVARVKAYEKLADLSLSELMKEMILDSATSAEMAQQYEILEKGRPGFYTKEFKDTTMKHLAELLRITTPQKTQNVNVNLDYADKIGEIWARRKRKQKKEGQNDNQNNNE